MGHHATVVFTATYSRNVRDRGRIDVKSFRSQYGPGVNSASNRNEYREYFLGVKAVGA